MKRIIFNLLLIFPLLIFSQRAKLYKGLPEKSYYANGNLRVVRKYNNKQITEYKTYYKSGELRSHHLFNSKGFHDGIANFYYPNGNIKTTWKYKKGVVKKRTDYKLNGEIIKDEKSLKKIKKCNYNLPYGPYKLSWTYRRAKLNSKLGFYDESLEDFNYILSKSNLRGASINLEESIYHSIAITHTYLEQYKQALEYDFKALSFDPENQAILNNIGWLFTRVKDYDLALEYLDKCHEVNPKNHLAFYNKAVVHLNKGDSKKALEVINKLIEEERSYKGSKNTFSAEQTAWTIRGGIYFKLEKYEEAIIDFEKALKENPANSSAYKFISLIYLKKGDLNKACEYLQNAKKYKHDKIHNTDQVETLLKKHCTEL